MHLYCIRTKLTFTFNHLSLFRKIKRQTKEWFVHTHKYIYAPNKEDALEKYKKYYFTSLKERLKCKIYLECSCYMYEEKSNNMQFKLPFNISIEDVEESFEIVEDALGKDIEDVKRNMIATDFRDWFLSNKNLN